MKSNTDEKTDWTEYYKDVPSYTNVTREISASKISNILGSFLDDKMLNFCELGGGNSFILKTLAKKFSLEKYHVVDLNEAGLDLLKKEDFNFYLTVEQSDVIVNYTNDYKYDLVFSVGLIEHFDELGTSKAIKAHFDRCVSSGFVFITFPTPTFLYRVIRKIAELLNVWKFPDERPLRFEEVSREVSKHGKVVHQSINWAIGLTQGYIMVKKH